MRLRSTIFVGLFLLGAAAGLRVDGQTVKRQGSRPTGAGPSFVRMTQQEVTLLLADLGASNPAILKQLAEDPELRRAQLDNLKQLLAFATQAQKDGLAAVPLHAKELKYIRDETIAVNYDHHLNKGKPTLPFNLISDAQVQSYWGESPGNKLSASLKRDRNIGFQEFFDTKVTLLKAADPQLKDRAVTDEERQQARDLYAKIYIYADEYARRFALLPKSLDDKVNLQVKLQQAQFLARLYSETIVSRAVVSENEIAEYIEAHPDFDLTAKRNKATAILNRAKGGEDFAKLANEFSEDPGNRNDKGEPQGGFYQNVGRGTMVAPFEQAALALQAGQVSPDLVQSDFGFHIIKLERRGKTGGQNSAETYDVRHILIATGVEDPSGPTGRFMSIKEYVKKKLEDEKAQRLIDELVSANKISVPADFTVPTVPKKGEPPTKAVPAPARKPKSGSRKRS